MSRSQVRSLLTPHLAALLAVSLGCGEQRSPQPDSSDRTPPASGLSATSPSGPGEAVGYSYDDAGNLLALGTQPAPAPSITDFNPKAGGAGQVVTVWGTGFRPTQGATIVTLAGVSAQVLAVTSNELRFAVPAGAPTGVIRVVVGGASATSSASFTVLSSVVVEGFSPAAGRPGTWVTITGANFLPVPSGNTVRIGAGATVVRSATSTTLVVEAGSTIGSGRITVTTSAGTGTSAADFYVLPVDLAGWDVGYKGRVSAEASQVVTMASSSGQAGLLLFEGLQGQALTVVLSGSTYTGNTQAAIYAPANVLIVSGGVAKGAETKLTPPPLPSTGT